MSELEKQIQTAESLVKFYTDRVEEQLQWLESGIANLRPYLPTGEKVDDQRNLVAKAGDVADFAGKLNAAIATLYALKQVRDKDAQ